MQSLGTTESAPEERISFKDAKANFYAAAKEGLKAKIRWLDGKVHPVTTIIMEELLPLARKGLTGFGIDSEDIELYLGIIEGRARTGRNGAAWQRAYTAKHGRDENRLCLAYMERQQSGLPVHEWSI
jgi:hypothetical protein